MAGELTYVLITPYSLIKSRTGNIVARLMSLSGCDLVGVRMLRPSDEFVDGYVGQIREQHVDPNVEDVLIRYIDQNLRPANVLGQANRCMLLLFEGANAVQRIYDVVGSLDHAEIKSDTIRGTYGDFLTTVGGEIRHFEPAVLVPTDVTSAAENLRLFAEIGLNDSGIYEDCCEGETTLVILKPDNFFKHSVRPGNMIDMFSKTGLRIVGARMIRMSAAQGNEFYGFLRDVFKKKLKGRVANRIQEAIDDLFGFEISDEEYAQMADVIAGKNAEYEFSSIVKYMTGLEIAEVAAEDMTRPGRHTALALLYRGPDAVQKIRERLGVTDPLQAAAGTIRSDFGQNVMQNAAHASDSVENAVRERKIIGLYADSGDTIREIITERLGLKV